jgi:hypothetical protein
MWAGRHPATRGWATIWFWLPIALASHRDAATLERIAFWDAGAPGYRWNGILRDELAKHGATTTSATQSRQLCAGDD